MSKKVSILVSSLHKGSFAQKIAQDIISTFSEGYEVQIVEIGCLPLYDFDYDDPAVTDFSALPGYTKFRETIKASADILSMTSENDRTVPACLKNAIDTGSKPNADVAWKKTPAGIISHFVSKMGGYSAQRSLRLALSYLDILLTGRSEVFLGNSPTLFGDNGQLIESVREFVQGYTNQLATLAEKDLKQSGLKHTDYLKIKFQTTSSSAKN